jgi:small conductance mechanosensitive channel
MVAKEMSKELFVLQKTALYAQAALLFVCLFAQGAPLLAQETSAESADQKVGLTEREKLLDTGKKLSNELERLSGDLSELNKTARKSTGEEKALLWNQIRNKREELASSLERSVKLVEDLEDAGQDAAQLRQLAARLLEDISADLEKAIEESRTRVIELREQRSSAAPEELDAVDTELQELGTALDEDLTAYLQVTKLMEAQGIDPAAQLRFLDKTVQERAERLSAVLQFLTEKRASIDTLAPGVSEEEKQAQAAELGMIDGWVDAAASHLDATVAIMKARKLETAPYTQLLIESTGELTEDIFQTEVAFGLLQGWLESGKDWVIDNGPRWLFKIIVFVLILVAFKFLAGIAKRLVRKAVTTSKIDLSQLLQKQIISFSGKVVMFLGLLVALSQLGIQLAPVLAGLGIAGFIVGFALQDTLSNFAAGMMILVYRPFDVGDAVEAGGVMGTVKAMNLVSTTITTWDNQKMVVPNSKIWGDVIRNITAEPHRRVDMVFGIAYADDIDHAERVLWGIVNSNEQVLAEPEPVVRLHTLGESSVDFVVRPWARTADYWTVYWDITRAVKKRFDEEGISIPFPQRDVHLIQENPAT